MNRVHISRRQALRLLGVGGAGLLWGCSGHKAESPFKTVTPGVLQVASAFPDPPFEVERGGEDTGFDAELMQHICRALGLTWQLVKYPGENFNGIFDGLAEGRYDAVASGTTITPEREKVALFSEPYAEFNQGLMVNAVRTPQIKSAQDLHGQVVGIQAGNTSDIVARKLLAEGAIRDIHYYPYDGILAALDDLSAGRIGAIIKLFPVATWFVKGRPGLAVVAQIPTHEKLGIAFAKANTGLCAAVNKALADLKGRGVIDDLRRQWFGELPKG
jgi:ABC-type amino acid transport substrate-binding protein